MATKRLTVRGFALVTLLMMIPVILLMIGALFAHLQSGSQWSGSRYGSTAAQYAAEAGAQHAVQELKAAPDWVTGFTDQPMAGGKGAYSIVFNQTKTGFQSRHSVNNFDGEHPDSPLGPDTVPNGAALIAVEGKVGAYTKLSYFIVGTGDDTIRVKQALLASGKIKMEGETKLTAVESMAERGTLDAVAHSNEDSGGSDLITWSPGVNGGSLLVEGEVKSSGSSSSAIDLSGYTPTNGTVTNAAKEAIPPAGIEAKVFMKRAATAFPGGTSVPSGDNYYDATSSALVISGDLVLNGNLYVEGDLQVNGSVSGNGSLYVSGDTSLFGDSRIDADDKVALYSHGNVTLSGFDGDAYLDGIAAGDPDFAAWLADARWAVQETQDRMMNGLWLGGASSTVDQLKSVLAPNNINYDSQISGRNGSTLYWMRDKLEKEFPLSPTRTFMEKKLQIVEHMFSSDTVLGPSPSAIIDDYYNNGNLAGIVDVANDEDRQDLKYAAFNAVRQINYDKLGASYFQGLIYTNGGFYADNQVTVLGAVVVNNDGTQSPFTAPSGDTVNPGELVLKGGSNITYVKDFFFGPNAGGTPGPRRVLIHLGDG